MHRLHRVARHLGAHGSPVAGGQPDASDLYAVLGVERDASDEDIRKAYRRAAVKHHPDKGGDAEQFQRIARANEVLSDATLREVYDQYGEEGVEAHQQGGQASGGDGGGANDPFSMFEELFGGAFGAGGRRRQQRRQRSSPKDQVFELNCGLADAYNGKHLNVTIERSARCGTCTGKGVSTGTREEAAMPCSACRGSGVTVGVQRMGGFTQRVQMTCRECNGAGFTMDTALLCTTCNGAGANKERAKLGVHIPRGTDEDEPIRLPGEGNFTIGVGAADVVFVIRFKRHEVFERRGNDLILRQELSLGEALGGTRLLLRQLDGRRLLVTTAPGDVLHPSGAGSLRRVQGEGMPRRDGTAGDLLIKFAIAFPEPGTLSAEDQAVLLALLSRGGVGSNGLAEDGVTAIPPVRVPDGDTETESWDLNGADEYVMEPAALNGSGEYEDGEGEGRREEGEPRMFFGGMRGPWTRRGAE